MLTIAHKCSRFSSPFMAFAAAFCMAALFCAASAAGAEPEAANAGGAQTATMEGGKTEGAQGDTVEAGGADDHAAVRAPSQKKKIVFAQFDVVNTQHVDDINNVYDGLPLTLASRLEATGGFLTMYAGRPVPAEAGEVQRKAVIQIAGEAGAQLLVSGMVVNAGTKRVKGNFETWFKESVTRHIEIEFAVYDGATGACLLSRRMAEQAQGDVRVGNDKPFGSSIFFETELGKALDRLIGHAVEDILVALEKVPFSAHVVRATGKQVFLDAGSDSLLRPGDKLVAFVSDASAPVVGLKGAVLGVMDRAADIVTLTRVQPRFSIGELSDDATKLGIQAGSMVRIDPVEQRRLAEIRAATELIAAVQQAAKAEEERVKAELAAQAEAARVKAEQEAKAEKKAREQAAAEAKAAKSKAMQEARIARIKAAQEARARELARAKARAAAEAKAAKLKAKREAEAEAARIKAEEKAQEKARAEEKTQQGVEAEPAKAEPAKTEPAKTEPAKTEPDKPVVEIEWSKPKPVAPLKLKQIK